MILDQTFQVKFDLKLSKDETEVSIFYQRSFKNQDFIKVILATGLSHEDENVKMKNILKTQTE